MALLTKSSGTFCKTSKGSSCAVSRIQNCIRSRVKASGESNALAGRVNAASAIEAITSPAIPSLRDIIFGSTGAQLPLGELAVTRPVEQLQEGYLLSDWSQRFLRQIPALPNGEKALHQLLTSFEKAKAKAVAGSSGHGGVVEAYLQLALVDITSQCWHQRLQELDSLQTRLEQENSQLTEVGQQMLQARMALSGCRYMRLDAVNALAKQVHMVMDDCGHSPALTTEPLPPPHEIGINFGQLLEQGLNVDLHNPVIRSLSGSELESLKGLSWSEYHTKSLDPELVGEWQFCFWYGSASLVPAPYAKFSTSQLAGLLTPELVLNSLANGVCGRALVGAAVQYGVILDRWAEPSRVMAGAGHVGSASAWLFLESQLGVRGNLHKVRQVALAVAAAAVTMLHQQQQ